MNFQIILKPTAAEVATAVCEWMIETIHSAIHERGVCSIALSGGSTPKRLYEWIAENELHCVDWSKVILLWGDERNVPHDHEDSNYGMVRKAWLDRAESTQEPRSIPQVYPVPITSNAPDHIAFEYSQTIRKSMRVSGLDSTATPVIDIVLLGLGDDAHTASIFPDTLAAQPSDDLFMANFVPKLGVYRFTMTAKLINSARRIAFLVCGASKQPAIDMVWHGPREPERYPAQWIQPVHGELLWFIDAAAQPERRDP
jgi:6-phosphogluconolactonase